MMKKKVLIVDDEIDLIAIAKLNLEKTGKFEVETMSDASGIMSRVRAFKPDVIVLDILMPKTDGVDVCRMLNEDPEGRRIPIIILSALETDKDKLMMYKLGVADVLAKPVETSVLIARIEKALQSK